MPPDLALGALAQALGLPVHAEHDALGDALTTAQVFIASVSHLDTIEAQTVRSLTQAERRLQTMRTYHR